MKILIDTNIVYTYLSGRNDPYADQCETIMRLCAADRIEGYIALHSLSTIWYLTRKAPEKMRRGFIRRICCILTVAGADQQAVMAAVDNVGFHDFEDALQDCCAVESGSDYIVTVNKRDFSDHSMTPPVTPEEFLEIFNQSNP